MGVVVCPMVENPLRFMTSEFPHVSGHVLLSTPLNRRVSTGASLYFLTPVSDSSPAGGL